MQRRPGPIRLLLLVATLSVILLPATGIFTARGQSVEGELRQLPEPPSLSLVSASRLASSTASRLAARAEAEVVGLASAAHVRAMARHMGLLDRPVRPPLLDALRPDETLRHFRRRWHLRTRELQALNPSVDLDAVEAGDELVVWRHDPANPAQSRRRPNSGSLVNGEIMPEGNGWIVQDVERAFGAPQTIEALVHGQRVTMAEHPDGQELLVCDLSFYQGGYMRPHRSHQSGRDVDVTYHRRTRETPTFTRARPSNLDQKRTWEFLRTLITWHDTVYVFMDRRLQVSLMEYAESIGEHPAFLDEVFQYGPRHHRSSSAIVRWARGHHDHMHIRFGCSENDIRCRHARYTQ